MTRGYKKINKDGKYSSRAEVGIDNSYKSSLDCKMEVKMYRAKRCRFKIKLLGSSVWMEKTRT